ncbi:replication-relaxation family protein [Streptomyces sp. NPDC098789]|uniref:replication-relaxation family protein n=1 Tax=Streptomyces sp. NPDC098789 TaxID=3366098 RepID=UPI0038111429
MGGGRGEVVGGTKARKYGSTDKTRSQVLEALGVVKIATAGQIRLLMCPGTADAATVRGGCKDLEAEGLVISAGRSVGVNTAGNRVSEKLWSLTPAGLDAAAVVLDRVAREMGGTAKAAAASGAKHALRVTDTLGAFLQTPPEPTAPVLRKGAIPRPAPALAERPPGLGPIAAWSTEVSLPVTGSFAAPGRGSVRADMVFVSPGAPVPLLFVEVDNGTEGPPIVARKIGQYRRFFRRTVSQGGRDVVLWRTLWSAPEQPAHPPLALVFTRQMDPAAMETRMREVAALSEPAWKGQWQKAFDSYGGAHVRDGYREYAGTVPVIVTVLDLLERRGPHGEVWWRYGREGWQTLADALDTPDDYRAYRVREDQRRLIADAAREQEKREAERQRQRREAAAWPCPECGRKVYPGGMNDDWSEAAVVRGGLCSICQSRADSAAREALVLAQERAELEEQARLNGPFGFLRRPRPPH